MNAKISKFLLKVIVNSLNTQQINSLGESLDRNFNVYTVSGFSEKIVMQRQTAADTLLYYFTEDEDAARLFAEMLRYEGKRFGSRNLVIWGRDEFIDLLASYKWIYDPQLRYFFLDPFYEREINYLKKLRLIDLRHDPDMTNILSTVSTISGKMGVKDLEWRIAVRLYDLDRASGELVRKIIEMLLSRQDLGFVASEMFVCFKELAINASKANYKRLYEKYVAAPMGVSSATNYPKFLEMFRNELDENGNSNLIEYARLDDRYIGVTFQSTAEFIEIWVTNNQTLTEIEKKQVFSKIEGRRAMTDDYVVDDEFVEGAGLGLNLVLNILAKYSPDLHPLKVVFYPSSIKIGFSLRRADVKNARPQ